MRILFLSHCLPFPPDKGDRIRAFHQLEYLSRRGHDIHLLALTKERPKPDFLARLQQLCASVHVFPISRSAATARSALGLLGRESLTVRFLWSSHMFLEVREMISKRKVDVVLAYCSSTVPYAREATRLPKILDMVDVDSVKWRDYSRVSHFPMKSLYRLEAHRLARLEQASVDAFDCLVFTTRREVEHLRSHLQDERFLVIPNGIDFDYYQRADQNRSPSPSVAFVGQMDYLPNIEGATFFADEVLPVLQLQHSGTTFSIVGRRPTRSVRRLGRNPGVLVTGEVEDVRPYLQAAWAFVAPMRIARGIQNKVLEAMAMEVPVVCSPQVMAGLGDSDLRAGDDLFVAETPMEYKQALNYLLRDPRVGSQMAANARRKIAEHYVWDTHLAKLENALTKAVIKKKEV